MTCSSTQLLWAATQRTAPVPLRNYSEPVLQLFSDFNPEVAHCGCHLLQHEPTLRDGLRLPAVARFPFSCWSDARVSFRLTVAFSTSLFPSGGFLLI